MIQEFIKEHCEQEMYVWEVSIYKSLQTKVNKAYKKPEMDKETFDKKVLEECSIFNNTGQDSLSTAMVFIKKATEYRLKFYNNIKEDDYGQSETENPDAGRKAANS